MIPEKIRVGVMVYTVVRVKKIKIKDGGTALGELNKIDQKITLVKKLHGTFEAAVLVHEIFHAIFEDCGLEDHEGTIDQLSYSLLDLVRQNPALFDYIKEQIL